MKLYMKKAVGNKNFKFIYNGQKSCPAGTLDELNNVSKLKGVVKTKCIRERKVLKKSLVGDDYEGQWFQGLNDRFFGGEKISREDYKAISEMKVSDVIKGDITFLVNGNDKPKNLSELKPGETITDVKISGGIIAPNNTFESGDLQRWLKTPSGISFLKIAAENKNATFGQLLGAPAKANGSKVSQPVLPTTALSPQQKTQRINNIINAPSNSTNRVNQVTALKDLAKLEPGMELSYSDTDKAYVLKLNNKKISSVEGSEYNVTIKDIQKMIVEAVKNEKARDNLGDRIANQLKDIGVSYNKSTNLYFEKKGNDPMRIYTREEFKKELPRLNEELSTMKRLEKINDIIVELGSENYDIKHNEDDGTFTVNMPGVDNLLIDEVNLINSQNPKKYIEGKMEEIKLVNKEKNADEKEGKDKNLNNVGVDSFDKTRVKYEKGKACPSTEDIKTGIKASKALSELKRSMQKYGRSGHFSITRRHMLSKNANTLKGVKSLQTILGSLKMDGDKDIFTATADALKDKSSDFYKAIRKDRMFRGSLRRLGGRNLNNNVDGSFGDSTRLAVAYFQHLKSGKFDGAFGKNTLSLLEGSKEFKSCIAPASFKVGERSNTLFESSNAKGEVVNEKLSEDSTLPDRADSLTIKQKLNVHYADDGFKLNTKDTYTPTRKTMKKTIRGKERTLIQIEDSKGKTAYIATDPDGKGGDKNINVKKYTGEVTDNVGVDPADEDEVENKSAIDKAFPIAKNSAELLADLKNGKDKDLTIPMAKPVQKKDPKTKSLLSKAVEKTSERLRKRFESAAKNRVTPAKGDKVTLLTNVKARDINGKRLKTKFENGKKYEVAEGKIITKTIKGKSRTLVPVKLGGNTVYLLQDIKGNKETNFTLLKKSEETITGAPVNLKILGFSTV